MAGGGELRGCAFFKGRIFLNRIFLDSIFPVAFLLDCILQIIAFRLYPPGCVLFQALSINPSSFILLGCTMLGRITARSHCWVALLGRNLLDVIFVIVSFRAALIL